MTESARTWWKAAGIAALTVGGLALLYLFQPQWGPGQHGGALDQPPEPPNLPVPVMAPPAPEPLPPPPRPELGMALFDRILYGMTEQDVAALLQSEPDAASTEYQPAGEFTAPRRIVWKEWEDPDRKLRLRLGFVNGKLEEKALELIERESP